MGNQSGRIVFSIFLILAGVLALLANLNILPLGIALNQPMLAMLFGIGSLAFLAAFVSSLRENWWAVIPALVLASIAMLIGFPVFWSVTGGSLFLGMLALAFWIVFITAPRERWWAVIPGGILLTLAAISLITLDRGDGMVEGGLFFMGIGLTFALVFLVQRARWALWPAGILTGMGSLILLGAGGIAALVFPALLIVFGGLLVIRAFQSRHA